MKKPGPKDLRQGIFPLAARIPGFLITVENILLSIKGVVNCRILTLLLSLISC